MQNITGKMKLFSEKATELSGKIKDAIVNRHDEIEEGPKATVPNTNQPNGIKAGEGSSLLTGTSASKKAGSYGGFGGK